MMVAFSPLAGYGKLFRKDFSIANIKTASAEIKRINLFGFIFMDS